MTYCDGRLSGFLGRGRRCQVLEAPSRSPTTNHPIPSTRRPAPALDATTATLFTIPQSTNLGHLQPHSSALSTTSTFLACFLGHPAPSSIHLARLPLISFAIVRNPHHWISSINLLKSLEDRHKPIAILILTILTSTLILGRMSCLSGLFAGHRPPVKCTLTLTR